VDSAGRRKTPNMRREGPQPKTVRPPGETEHSRATCAKRPPDLLVIICIAFLMWLMSTDFRCRSCHQKFDQTTHLGKRETLSPPVLLAWQRKMQKPLQRRPDAVWGVSTEANKEDGNHPARPIHVHILWQGCCKAHKRWHLEMQSMQQGPCWRRLGGVHNCGSHSAQHCASVEGTHRSLSLHSYVFCFRTCTL